MTHCPKSQSTLYRCSIPVAVADILRHMARKDPTYADVLEGYMQSMCATCPTSTDDL
jgi:hypothetical protein